MKKLTKAQQARADEVYRRGLQESLPLDQGAPAAPSHEHYDAVPTACVGCDKAMKLASGWTLLFGDLLQCGACGTIIEVPRAEYERYAAALHDYFARLNAVEPKREKRQRGAG